MSLIELLEFHSNIKESVTVGSYLDRIVDWMSTNTYTKGRNWSFKDHEFQLGIVKDPRREMVVQKCSQVGITELEVRRALGFISLNIGVTVIYTLPTRNFAMKFSKGRIDPVITTSPYLKKLMVAGADGSEFKQIGSGFVYLGGSQNASQAISIPADYLVQDEIDFCNPAAVSAYESRIRHSDHKVKRVFSTPTVSGYGVNKAIQETSQASYSFKCKRCNKESFIDFFKDVVVPGFEREFAKFEKADIFDERIHWRDAYLTCPKCRCNIDEALADPSTRRWVHKYPNKDMAGYYIKPFDLMKYNPTAKVIEQIKGYERLQDYHNFVHGVTYKSDENEINIATVMNNSVLDFQHEAEGCYMGVDVGKKLRVTIIKHVDGKWNVVALYTVLSSSDTAGELETLYNQYGCYRMVIDSAPDWTLCKIMLSKLQTFTHPCVYVEENAKKPEAFYIKEDDNNMMLASRTVCLDMLVRVINKGDMLFPRCDEMSEVRTHFGGMKRVEHFDDNGQRKASWTKISENDHYFHSTLYAFLAARVDEPEVAEGVTVAPVGIMGATFNTPNMSTDMGVSIKDALHFMGISNNGR